MTQPEAILFSTCVPIIGSLAIILLNKRNAKIQTEGLIADQYYKLTERLKQERDELASRIDKNALLISVLEASASNSRRKLSMLSVDNEEWKFLHEVAELEIKHIKKISEIKNWQRELVYVLDDDPDVLDEFQEKFSKLSVLDFKGFIDVDIFLEKTREEQPSIVVLDYILDKGQTAQDVIDLLGYKPEIFIMSGERSFIKNFEGGTVTFFEKGQHFVLLIAKAIIRYLLNKSKSNE